MRCSESILHLLCRRLRYCRSDTQQTPRVAGKEPIMEQANHQRVRGVIDLLRAGRPFSEDEFWPADVTTDLSELFSVARNKVTCPGPWRIQRRSEDGIYEINEMISSISVPAEVRE